MQELQKNFENRDALVAHLKALTPWAEGERSYIQGSRQKAEMKLANVDPVGYAETRNFGDGKITRLSPYIHHGILSLNEVRNDALTKCGHP